MAYPSIVSSEPQPASTTQSKHASPALATSSGAECVVRELERQGIDWVAGIPGGAILPLYDALASSSIRHVLARHEQGACFIAQGAARATGRAAVCLATSGPGATNLVTALADAQADSIPLVAITAQVPRPLIGTDAFQEVNICKIAEPIVKACFQARDIEDLLRLLPRVFALANEGRPGPVLLDIPKDVLNERVSLAQALNPIAIIKEARPALTERVCKAATLADAAAASTWEHVAALIAQSKRPLLYVGGGIRVSGAAQALLQLARRADLPVVSSLHGLGAIPSDDPLHLGMLGMHGAPFTNMATDEADLVLALGVRFDDRATGDPTTFCRNARIVHIDVDRKEIGKLKAVELGIESDAKFALQRLLEVVPAQTRPKWRAQLEHLRREHDLLPACDAEHVLCAVAAGLDSSTLITTDVGQHQMWAAQWLRFSRPRALLTSGGLGTMGFGLPAAIGAALSCPRQRVLCVSGDGSLLMNIQELVTLAELNLDVTVLLLNNGQLGLVRQQQELFYGGRHLAAHFPNNVDFGRVARAFGVAGETIAAADFCAACPEILERRGPRVIEVIVSGADNVLPMVPPGRSNLEMIRR
jgi:acetolactate synthase I/II/III large subunit